MSSPWVIATLVSATNASISPWVGGRRHALLANVPRMSR
jgi:hypothetical protein